jgi:hypothetical protein
MIMIVGYLAIVGSLFGAYFLRLGDLEKANQAFARFWTFDRAKRVFAFAILSAIVAWASGALADRYWPRDWSLTVDLGAIGGGVMAVLALLHLVQVFGMVQGRRQSGLQRLAALKDGYYNNCVVPPFGTFWFYYWVNWEIDHGTKVIDGYEGSIDLRTGAIDVAEKSRYIGGASRHVRRLVVEFVRRANSEPTRWRLVFGDGRHDAFYQDVMGANAQTNVTIYAQGASAGLSSEVVLHRIEQWNGAQFVVVREPMMSVGNLSFFSKHYKRLPA